MPLTKRQIAPPPDRAHLRQAAIWGHYMPAKWLCDRRWGVNNFLHNKWVDAANARGVARLIVGGQGLRGGDVSRGVGVSVDNCCVWCLLKGVRVVENLHHVVFECDEYDSARCQGRARELLEGGAADVFLLHLGRWEWRDLVTLRNFFLDILVLRVSAIGGRRRCTRDF